MIPDIPHGELTAKQKRLYFVASRRSMAEMERILARFLKQELANLDDAACDRLLQLLDQWDSDLLEWMAGILPVPSSVCGETLGLVAKYRKEYVG